MHMKKLLLASSALALLTGASAAQAGDLYLSVFGGANWQSDSSAAESSSTIEYQTIEPETGFVLGGAIGGQLTNWAKGLRGELEVSYRRNDLAGAFSITYTSTVGVVDGNMSTFAILANVWYDFDFGWKVKPYVGAGAGWGRVHADGAFVSTGSGTFSTTTFDVTASGFAWQVGAGFNYEVMPDVEVGLGYRYFEGPDFTSTIGPVPGGLENENHSVLVNLSIGIN